jgi:Raf kinase inhibitor-like YbhB/YbcL family protein
MIKLAIAQLLALGVLAACSTQAAPAAIPQEAAMTFSITSTAFQPGQPVPGRYSCDGDGISPPLDWSGAPAGTNSFALIMDDPDAPAGTFVHWVIYNIPASATGLPENMPKDAMLPDGTVQGPNSARRLGYTPPCPPGGTHRYYFKLYALDAIFKLPNADKAQLEQAMEGHVLDKGELMGTFSR